MILLEVKSVGENVVRLTFDVEPYYSGLLDPPDASIPAHYSIVPVLGTSGYDGQPTRPVTVIVVTQTAGDADSLDLTLDRPMSPYPSQYVITFGGIEGSEEIAVIGQEGMSFVLGGDPNNELAPDPTVASFYGSYRALVAPQTAAATPSRDIANPQTLSALATATPYVTSALALGTFVVDSSGDYATDQGVISYKKRVLRRAIVKPGGFKHAPLYGVGIPSYGKKLASPSLRLQLAAAWESQVKQEPETATVTVTPTTNPNYPNLTFFNLAAEMKSGQKVNFSVPFATV
jgi:hypothetical protein